MTNAAVPLDRRMGRCIAAVALWVGGASAMAQVQGAWLVQEHGRWSSRISQDALEFRFRAAAATAVDGAAVVLAFDRFAGDCESLHASLNIRLPRPSTQSVVMLDDVGYLRVDERPIRMMKFHARLREGDEMVFLEITRVMGEGGLVPELRRGQTLRFKLGTERATYYVGLPLAGFAAATDRTLALCRQNDRHARELMPPRQPKPRGKEDRDYFED
jgi:hypothetical protein